MSCLQKCHPSVTKNDKMPITSLFLNRFSMIELIDFMMQHFLLGVILNMFLDLIFTGK